MLWFRVMKDLAKIAHVEILSAHWTMFEMLRLGLDRPVVVFARVASGLVVGTDLH